VAIPLPSHVQKRDTIIQPHDLDSYDQITEAAMLTEEHRLRAENLHLYGLLAHWTEIEDSAWVAQLLDWEEAERARRSLERRFEQCPYWSFQNL